MFYYISLSAVECSKFLDHSSNLYFNFRSVRLFLTELIFLDLISGVDELFEEKLKEELGSDEAVSKGRNLLQLRTQVRLSFKMFLLATHNILCIHTEVRRLENFHF